MLAKPHYRATSRRILIVSNRLPCTALVQEQGVRWQRSSGGLITGMHRVQEQWPSLWLGWSGTHASAQAPHDMQQDQDMQQYLESAGCVAVPLSENEVNAFYNRYSNSVLWPALHDGQEPLRVNAEDWHTYRCVNERFAQAVLDQYQPGDTIWVHDYHLLLVPRLLRERGCRVPVCLFLHTPFPQFTFAAVPQCSELLWGMLGADLIGFHTAEYARNFLGAVEVGQSCRVSADEIETAGRRTRICSEPMGIDFDAFNELGADPAVAAEAAAVRGTTGASVLLGVDRLDHTKGILQRLLAYERLLHQHPELRGRVRLLQLAVPTREAVSTYRDLRTHVEAIVARINRELGSPSWTPVEYAYKSVDRRTLVALYRAADVMLVTPLRDGLNLVAKEFVAARPDEDGVLVLSRRAGAAAELKQAVLVTPQRIDELAAACYNALLMPAAERRQRMQMLRGKVAANDVVGWATRILERLRPALPVVPRHHRHRKAFAGLLPSTL